MKRVAQPSCEGSVRSARERIESVRRTAVGEAKRSPNFGEAGQGLEDKAAPFQHASAEASLYL
jgi:hypothetical protein